MKLLKRKIDRYLLDWKNNPKRKPLIVKGARQIGKTESIRAFAKANYESVIEINFVLQKKFRAIFDAGYEVETIIKNISLMEPTWRFIPQKTLIFFDELQKCPDCATSLKSFCQDGRYDVICSGSLMGIYYEEIESNAVGFKDDFDMFSMDFEEFLWAKGYQPKQIEDMYRHMVELPLKGNYMDDYYKLYYHDTGLLIASLDEEAQEDLRANKNFGTYKGAIYENIVGEMLRKSGYEQLYFYKRENPALEMDFFVRDANSLIPVEVKAKDNATASLNNLIKWDSYSDVKYGIKLGYKNIGWNGQFYTFPYFLTFLLKRFLKERENGNE